MKAQYTDFIPGRIIYHVHGVSRTATKVDKSEVDKMTIISHPFMVKLGIDDFKHLSPFVKVQVEGSFGRYTTERSLHDMGVGAPGEDFSVYNLNRAFTSMESALDFCEQLKTDKFKDPVDAAYAAHFTPADQLARQEEQRQFDMWMDDIGFEESFENPGDY